ncbi:MAG: hypothetical protein K1Y36_05165 [Blastocatellia bacterium]|nr:hypothetical protein [Blastocatellia bacterium]
MERQPQRTFQIVQEKTPTRCEICHQDDQFDPIANFCRRCAPIGMIELASTKAELEERFTKTEGIGLTYFFRPVLRVSNLRRIACEAFHLYRQHFRVFLSILALMELPCAGLTLLFRQFWVLLPFIALAWVILNMLAGGALIKAAFDGFRGETPLPGKSYDFIRKRGWTFIWAAISGWVSRWGGFCSGAFLMVPLVQFLAETDPTLGSLFTLEWIWILAIPGILLAGLAIGALSYSHPAFAAELAAMEGCSYDEAFERSRWLGETNRLQLSNLNSVEWLARTITAIPIIAFHPWPLTFFAALVFPICLHGLLAQASIIFFIVMIGLRVVVIPYWKIFRTLLFLYLHHQAIGAEFAFRFTTSEPGENR